MEIVVNIGVRLGPPPHNIYDVRSFQRSFSAGHELPAIDDFNGSKAATEGGKKTENRHDLLLNRLFQSSLFPSPPHPQPLFMEVLTHPGDV